MSFPYTIKVTLLQRMMDMKKIVILIISLLLLVGIGFGVYYFKNANHIGADISYVKITTDGEKGKNVSFNYSYTMPAYDEAGKKQKLLFLQTKIYAKVLI